MTDTHDTDTRPWLATATQIGTNERMTVRGPTKEAVDLQLYGQAYAAEYGTVRYYREGAAT